MHRSAALVVLALLSGSVLAQPVRCVDEKGKVYYIDRSVAEQRKLNCKPVQDTTQTVPAQPGAINLKPQQQQKDDSAAKRQAIADAEARLAEAKKNLAEQEAVRYGNEKNYERVLERLKPFQDAVEQAQKNLEQARGSAR